MSLNSSRRFRLITLFCFALLLALGSAWVNMVLKKTTGGDGRSELRTDPDYYMDNFRLFKLKLTGEPDLELTGKKMTHYPDNDSILINFPVFESLDQKRRLQIAYADWAFIEDENSQIHMHENVVVLRPPTRDTQTFRLITDYLLYLQDQEVMRTDRDFTAYQGASIITGKGMQSNLASRELFIFNRARAVYPPRGARQ